jgi:DNA-binding CsgD family transcriptional regulator
VAKIVEGFDRVDVSDLAPRVEAPTLVLHVEEDARIPFEEGRRTAAAIPGAAFVPLPGVNHVLAPQDPAFEPFLTRVEEFLGAPGPSRSVARLVEDLTDRERDVLELLAAGLDNGAIAEALHISPKTVRNHVSNVFAKLGVGHRGEAVVRGRELGFGSASGRASHDSGEAVGETGTSAS